MLKAVVGLFSSSFFFISPSIPGPSHIFSCQADKPQGTDEATSTSITENVILGSDKQNEVESENLFQRTEVLAGAFRLEPNYFSDFSSILNNYATHVLC